MRSSGKRSHLKRSGRKRQLLLTRLATFSGFSRGCRNSAVRSIADWATGTAVGLVTARGAGSSLSSSSSIKAGSAFKKRFILNNERNLTNRTGCGRDSPIFTFFPSVYCSCRGLLRGSRGAGVDRVISLCGIPRSSSRVLI